MRPSLRVAARLALVALIGVSCGSDASPGSSDTLGTTVARVPSHSGHADVSGEIVVFAAASLTSAFGEIGDAFAAEHPNATVTFHFASSSDLATQIDQGAPADVYASADEANMTKLIEAGAHVGEPQVFATNVLQLIVEPGNPKRITGVGDLATPGLVYVTCPPEVPIGRYAAQVLDKAGVTVEPASLENNVKGIVTKVTLGEADAGIVYRTDVIAAGDAEGVDIPEDVNVVATYPVVVTKNARNAAGAAAFVDFLLDDRAQGILAGFGFGGP